MVKQLSLLTLAAVSIASFAMEDNARIVSLASLALEENAGYVIRSNEWEMIKKAVFAKMGEDFKQQFNEQYPTPSDDGVRALADQFDKYDPYGQKNRYNIWIKTFPGQLPIWIGGKCYYLFEGCMADIVVAYKRSCSVKKARKVYIYPHHKSDFKINLNKGNS